MSSVLLLMILNLCTATSLNSSEESPLRKKCAAAIEKEKHVIHATVDSGESTVTINTKEIWVQLHHSTLTKEGKSIIECGHRLTDKHINFASCLICCQFIG